MPGEIEVEVAATIDGLERLGRTVSAAVPAIVFDLGAETRNVFREFIPRGIPGNSTNPPGALGESVTVTGVGGNTVLVGPTLIYTRQRNYGGSIYPKRASMLRFYRFGQLYVVPEVYQRPSNYLLMTYVVVGREAATWTARRLRPIIARAG